MNNLHACPLLLAALLPLQDIQGTWSGRLTSASMSATIELDFRTDDPGPQGDGLFRSGPNEVRSSLADIARAGSTLRFTATIEGAQLHFEGQVAGDVMSGQFQVRERGELLDRGTWSAGRGAAPPAEAIPDDARLAPGDAQALVAAAAGVLRSRYVDAARGEELARALESRLAAGEYATLADARVLADQLGRDLFAVARDGHLKLSFSPEPLPPEAPDAPESPADREALREVLRAENFGFRKVEILPGNVGLLELSRFARADLAGEAASVAMGFLQNCDALVIDLRTCSGGDPAMVAFLATWLFEGQPTHVADMYRREDDLTVQWWTAAWVPYRRLAGVPVRVLTAARTYSAAEALAFHLQQLGRARVVGEVTGGGAHPSRRVRLLEHFAMTLPTSRTCDPVTQRDWEGVGVKPDLDVPAGDALLAAHLDILEVLAQAEPDPARVGVLRDIAAELRAD
jgi:retinol-binding protein 3